METAIITAISEAVGSLFGAVGSLFEWLSAGEKTTQTKYNTTSVFVNSMLGFSQADTAEELAELEAKKKALLYICLIIIAGVAALAFIKNKR